MQAFSASSLCGLLLSLLTLVNADISLSNIPTSACTGTATYTTSLTLETGSQLLSAGNLWKQAGAQWTFALPESSVDFASLGAIQVTNPGNPGGSSSREEALNLNPFRSMWTLTVPNPVPQNPYDIYFEVSTKTSKREEIPLSAKFRGRRDSGQFELDIEGTLDCGITPLGTSSSNGSTTIISLVSSQTYVSVVSPSSQFSTPSGISSILLTATSTTTTSRASTSSNSSTSASSLTPSTSSPISALSSSSSLSSPLSTSASAASSSAASTSSYTSTALNSSTTSTSPFVSSNSSSASSLNPSTPSIPMTSSSTSAVPLSKTSPTSSIPTSSRSSTSSLSLSRSVSTGQSTTTSSSSFLSTSLSSSVPPPTASTSSQSATTSAPTKPSTSVQAATTSAAPILGQSAIASSCSNNEFSPVAESWTAFSARAYMSSLLSAAEPSGKPTGPLAGASLIHSDVNPPGALCTYTAHCDPVSCSTVKDGNSGTELSVQRYLAYQSIVNFNNFLNSITTALLDAGTISSLLDANIVSVFFTNKAPDATAAQIFAIFTPFLSIFGSFLGPLGGFASAAIKNVGEAFKVAAQVGSSVTAGSVASNIKPVVDKRFTEYAGIADFVGEYLKAVVAGVEHAYDNIIGANASQVAWTGTGVATDPDIVRDGYFGAGVWVNSDYTVGLETNLLQRFIRVFTYKAINFAWIDSGCYIIYVPYGRAVKGIDGKVIEGGVDQHWCQTQLQNNDHLGVLTVCDAPGGMARIVNSDAYVNDWMRAYPKGFDDNFSVLPGETLDVAGAIRGSVASWLVGDFGYDASNPYNQSFSSGAGLPLDQIETLANLTIAPETAGFFNVPVCETFDLRYFPPASNAKCIACGFGGVPGSTKTFESAASDKVKKAITPPPDCVQAYINTICVKQCPDNLYGPEKAQQNAAGYSPGWCGVHVIQYQRNEGPGRDPSQFRLTATIFDAESININVPPNTPPGQNTLVQAPNGVAVGMTSRLPSPLMITVGPGDNDPVLFKYPGNADWGSNDQDHHCKFGKYDKGKREGDCGFTCG